ncbi:MAG: hypothetical protein QM796_13195 [Chthoniobacteraceae bacterium]
MVKQMAIAPTFTIRQTGGQADKTPVPGLVSVVFKITRKDAYAAGLAVSAPANIIVETSDENHTDDEDLLLANFSNPPPVGSPINGQFSLATRTGVARK